MAAAILGKGGAILVLFSITPTFKLVYRYRSNVNGAQNVK
jgi:hypothetical protein